MGLRVRRLEGETWREAVSRTADYMRGECLAEFDAMVAAGQDEAQAAFDALYEWDCLELTDEADDQGR